MSVYKPKNSPYYHFDFQVAGVRYHGSAETENRREAEKVEALARKKAKVEAKASRNAKGGPLTIADATGRYWLEVGQLHANSETTWTDLIRLKDYFGQTKLLIDITDDQVAKLVQWRRSQPAWGREKTADGKAMKLVSAATVNRSTTLVLKKIFTRAKRTWRYEFPAEPIWRDHWLQEPKERVRELKQSESSSLRLATRDDYEPIFEFARETGMRLNECILKWSEVDWQTGWIIKDGKGGRTVKTAITTRVREILLPLRAHHEEFVFTYVGQRAKLKGLRQPITYSGLKTHWKRLRAKAGVSDFRFHDFRHDVATKLLRETGNLETVRKALSHADIKTTTRYAHVLDEEVAAAMEKLSQKRKRANKA